MAGGVVPVTGIAVVAGIRIGPVHGVVGDAVAGSTRRIAACGGAFAGETRLHPDHTWTAVQGRIRRAFGAGRLVRIARPNGGHSYTAPGSYEVTFRADTDREWTFSVEIGRRGA